MKLLNPADAALPSASDAAHVLHNARDVIEQQANALHALAVTAAEPVVRWSGHADT